MPRNTPTRPRIDRKAASPRIDDSAAGLPEAAHLANVLAHRLRGLVSGIVGFTDLLLEQLGRKGQRDMAMRILESAQRIEHVLADLKHYTRPIEPVPESLPISVLLSEVARTVPEELAERIAFDLQGAQGRMAEADRYLTRDAIGLLLQNADEASRDGHPIRVRLQVNEEQGRISVIVLNRGQLDAATSHQVFEPFFTTKARNLGVGLPLARRIARAQGGDVVLGESPEPGWVAFEIRLLLTEEASDDPSTI